jgi:hypothetical protein
MLRQKPQHSQRSILIAVRRQIVFFASAITSTPVPEPGTSVMLLSGLGLLAFGFKRRKS